MSARRSTLWTDQGNEYISDVWPRKGPDRLRKTEKNRGYRCIRNRERQKEAGIVSVLYPTVSHTEDYLKEQERLLTEVGKDEK